MKGYLFEVALSAEGKVGGVVLADQVRRLDWKARRVEFGGKASQEVVRKALGKSSATIQFL